MNQAFQALWAFLFMLLLLVLVLATAKSNHLIVWDGPQFDFAALLLGSVALIVTCLGIFIAVLAFWGAKEVSELKANAISRAVEEAVKAAKDVAKPIAARTALEYAKSQAGDGSAVTDADVQAIVQGVESDD